jgi:hypothetical protein
MINEAVTMIQVGKDGEYYIYEPINTFLKSPEQGLRYFQSMNVDDPYTGVGDLAPWGMSLVGPISDDEKWMVNPSAVNDDEHGEIHLPITDSSTTERYSISSPELPQAGTATTYNHRPSDFGTEDVDISLMAEFGEAVTRGASAAAAQAHLPPSTATSPGTMLASSLMNSPNMQDNFKDEDAASAYADRTVTQHAETQSSDVMRSRSMLHKPRKVALERRLPLSSPQPELLPALVPAN